MGRGTDAAPASARDADLRLGRRDGLVRLIGWGCGAAGLAGLLPRARAAAPAFHTQPLAPDSWHHGFALRDVHGTLRRSTSFPGEVLVLFFGFLSCPSICPTTMWELGMAQRAMGAQGRRVRIAFATLDPERDAADAMVAWLAQFGPRHLGLRDSPEAIAAAAGALRLAYRRVPGRQPGSYTIDHGVQAYVFDPKGRLRLIVRPGPTPEEVAADLTLLLQGA